MSTYVRKRLYFDLETSPNIGFFWRPGQRISVGYENIIKERAIICVAWKWEHQKIISSLTWDSKQSDKQLLKEFITIINQADEIIAHNGDRFDIKWLRTRCIKHRIPMFPQYTSIDTLKLARSQFNFNSNRLDYLAHFLNDERKIKVGYDLWRSVVLDKDEKSLKKMVKYCKHDVKVLEDLFQTINPYVKPKTSVARRPIDCPECGCSDTILNNKKRRASGHVAIQLHCKNDECSKYFTIPESTYKKYLL